MIRSYFGNYIFIERSNPNYSDMAACYIILLCSRNSPVAVAPYWSLFEHNTCLYSRIMNYIHSSSPLFSGIQNIMGKNSGETCRFCNNFDGSPEHQLLLCLEVIENVTETTGFTTAFTHDLQDIRKEW